MENTKRKKILLVDDEQEVLTSLGDILRRADFDVITTDKGKEAVELAETQRPDLIMLDVVMPDMPGDSVASVLSREPSTVNIPIVFLTGILTKEEQPAGKKIGKCYVISKPTTTSEVLDLIRKILKT